MNKFPLLAIVALVAIIALVFLSSNQGTELVELNLMATGQAAYGQTVERGSVNKADCEKTTLKIEAYVIQFIDKTEEYNIKWDKWSKTTNSFALFLAQNYSNSTSWQYYNHNLTFLYYKEEITKLKKEALSIKSELKQLHAKMQSLSVDAQHCQMIILCPLCPGEEGERIKGKCDIYSVKIDEFMAEIDALLLDIHVNWELYEKETVTNLLIFEQLANDSLRTNVSNLTTTIIHASFKKLEKHQKAALDIHLGIIKLRAKWKSIMVEFIRCVTRNCDECKKSKVKPITVPKDKATAISTPEVTDLVQTEPIHKSCSELCADKNLLPKAQDWTSFVEKTLNSKECVKQARIDLGKIVKYGEECICYPQTPPKIDFSGKMECDSPCGVVPCNGEASCPCPGRENCVLTVKCLWGGWKKIKVEPPIGVYQYAPMVTSGQ